MASTRSPNSERDPVLDERASNRGTLLWPSSDVDGRSRLSVEMVPSIHLVPYRVGGRNQLGPTRTNQDQLGPTTELV